MNCKEEVTRGVKPCKLGGTKCRETAKDVPQIELFKVELSRLLDRTHELVKLAESINWLRFEKSFDVIWEEVQGRPAIDTRLMVSLHYLKYTFDLSDEVAVEGWKQNSYWQYLGGMRHFQHDVPLDPSSMSRWRKKVGQAGAGELLSESIAAGLKLKAIKKAN